MKMNIIFLNFWSKGGMRHYSDALAGLLSKENKVNYFSNYTNLGGDNRDVFPISLKLFDLKNYTALIRMVFRLFQLKPDVVHLNSGYPTLLPFYFIFGFFNSVVTVHDAIPHEGETFFKKIFTQVQLLAFSLFFKKIIVHSAGIRDELPVFVNKSKVYIAPFVDFKHLVKKFPQASDRSKLHVLFFGRILEYKGLRYLVEAFKELDEEYQLVIAGEGSIDSEINQSNITVLNRFVSDEEMARLFDAADVVATPYISASQSGVINFALANNKPVITTAVGAIKEVVFNDVNGLIIEPRSSEEIRDAIITLRNKDKYQSLVRNIEASNKENDRLVLDCLGTVYSQ